MPKTEVISARITPELKQRALILADIRGQDRQDVVIEALVAALENASPDEHAEIERRLVPMCHYCNTRHWGYQDHYGA